MSNNDTVARKESKLKLSLKEFVFVGIVLTGIISAFTIVRFTAKANTKEIELLKTKTSAHEKTLLSIEFIKKDIAEIKDDLKYLRRRSSSRGSNTGR